MARKIIPEEKEMSSIHKDSFMKTNYENITNHGETMISSNEIEKLFYEWEINGHNDLVVDEILAKRIMKYLRYQRKLNKIRKKMARQIYEPFKITYGLLYKTFNDTGVLAGLYIDDCFIGYVRIYWYKGMFRIMNIDDFKIMLIALKKPYAVWITAKYVKVDINAYIKSIGRNVQVLESEEVIKSYRVEVS